MFPISSYGLAMLLRSYSRTPQSCSFAMSLVVSSCPLSVSSCPLSVSSCPLFVSSCPLCHHVRCPCHHVPCVIMSVVRVIMSVDCVIMSLVRVVMSVVRVVMPIVRVVMPVVHAVVSLHFLVHVPWQSPLVMSLCCVPSPCSLIVPLLCVGSDSCCFVMRPVSQCAWCSSVLSGSHERPRRCLLSEWHGHLPTLQRPDHRQGELPSDCDAQPITASAAPCTCHNVKV